MTKWQGIKRPVIILSVIAVFFFIFSILSKSPSQIPSTILVTSKPTIFSLITEPNDGIAPVISMINNATKSVDLVMYQLEDTQVEQALASAQARGVAIRVLLNPGYYGGQEAANQPAYKYRYILHRHILP